MDTDRNAKSLEEKTAEEAADRGASARAIGLYLGAERVYRAKGDYVSAERARRQADIIDTDLRAWVED